MVLPLILYDVALFLLSTLLYGGAITTSVLLGIKLFELLPLIVFLFLIPSLFVVMIITLILEVWIVRRMLPKLKEGYYEVPNSLGFALWTLNLTFGRLLFLDPIKNIILFSGTLRFLTFKALGGKVAYGTSVSANVDLIDISMYSVGKGSVIGAGTTITGHFINKDKINLGKIVIGENVNIGAFCRIAPNVHIGDNTWIGAECKISPMVRVGNNCIIEPLSVIPPGTRLNDGETFPGKK